MQNEITIKDFSPHLFWDMDKSKIDFEKSKSQIIFQVVEYGMMKDWNLIHQLYSREEIKKVVVNLRSLDKKTLNFLAVYFNLDKTSFRCYKNSQ
jgi:hypothetical protein